MPKAKRDWASEPSVSNHVHGSNGYLRLPLRDLDETPLNLNGNPVPICACVHLHLRQLCTAYCAMRVLHVMEMKIPLEKKVPITTKWIDKIFLLVFLGIHDRGCEWLCPIIWHFIRPFCTESRCDREPTIGFVWLGALHYRAIGPRFAPPVKQKSSHHPGQIFRKLLCSHFLVQIHICSHFRTNLFIFRRPS